MSNVGDRETSWTRPSSEVVERFASLEVTNISDAQFGHGTMSSSLVRMVPTPASVAGPALTVSITPGNGKAIRRAIDVARPGDVLVVNGHGNTDRAVIGGNVLMLAAAAGIIAAVVDGAIRDLDEASRVGLMLMARSVTPRSGVNDLGKGEIGYPVACGGVAVCAGDIVVVDPDGVVVVPRDDAASVARQAADVQARKGSSMDFEERWTRIREEAQRAG